MAKDNKKASETAEASAPEETKSTKKAKKSETKSKKNSEKKPNMFQAIGKWFHDLRVEFKNVTWPSWNTVAVNTGVVLTVIVTGSVFVGLLDSGLLKLLEFLIGLGQQ